MRLRILLTTLVVLAVGGVLFYPKLLGLFPQLPFQREQTTEESQPTELREIGEAESAAETEAIINKEISTLPKPAKTEPASTEKEVSAPGPLVSPTPAPPAPAEPPPTAPPPSLTSSGIISETNAQRQQNGMATLSTNTTLNATALSKANDMCANQYFAHTSPAGLGAGDLATNAGYDYLSIGENLARGPFTSNAAVVEAWMNSPGHRANILNPKFTEMGAAAVQCTYQGKITWMAVQHFGKPASACSRPDAALLSTINDNKANLTNMRDNLVTLRAEIEATSSDDPSYAAKIDSYNNMVKQYNALLTQTRSLISQYNDQVSAFNLCAA